MPTSPRAARRPRRSPARPGVPAAGPSRPTPRRPPRRRRRTRTSPAPGRAPALAAAIAAIAAIAATAAVMAIALARTVTATPAVPSHATPIGTAAGTAGATALVPVRPPSAPGFAPDPGAAPRSGPETPSGNRLATAGAPATLVPGIVFGWTDPVTEALLRVRLGSGAAVLERLAGVALLARHVSLAGYRVDRDAGTLTLRVRADRGGVLALRRIQLELRGAPALTLPLHAAAVLSLDRGDGPLALRQWASDDAVGLYAAFALSNESPAPVTVQALRYAPGRLGRGLILTATGPPAGFAAWKDAVLERSDAAFDAYLRARGHDPRVPGRTLPPTALAFPLTGRLAAARWRASDALDSRVAPGEALYLAVTPAAFSSYVHGLAIDAYPVLGYEEGGGCCRWQGVRAPIVHLPAPGRDGRAP